VPPPCELRPIAYRVSPLPRPALPSPPHLPWPAVALVIETVATEGLAGPARFGFYLVCQGERVLARGLFHGPGLIRGDDQALLWLSRRLKLEPPYTLEQLLELLYRYAVNKRLPLVAFNLPAHLARIAADWTATAPVRRRRKRKRGSRPRRRPRGRRSQSVFGGGVSLILWTVAAPQKRGQRRLRNGGFENGFRPRVRCKLLGDGTVFMDVPLPSAPFKTDLAPEGGGKPDGSWPPRRLLTLERLYLALTGQRTRSLAAACARFAIDCPPDEPTGPDDLVRLAEHCLARCEAAHRLYQRLLDLHGRYRLPVAPDRVASAGTYAKATLETIGITPPLTRYHGTPAGLGAAACAAYGGWSGVGIRSLPASAPVPVRLVDAAGMYPVCAHKLAIWPLLTAEQLHLEPVLPAEIEQWIARQTPGTFTLTPGLNVLCRRASAGAVLPQRIQPFSTWLTTVAALRCEQALWWPLPDLVHSYFETGAVPKLEACLRLTGTARLPALRPVELPGLGRFDPNQPGADLFLFLAIARLKLEAGAGDFDDAERARLASVYKLWDNSACSGIYLEVHPEEPSKRPRNGTVIGPDGPYETKAHSFEEPGRWYFPPFYSLVTGAARLLLYLAMREVQAASGTVAYWDTDGLAILATRNGGTVPTPDGGEALALSYADVDAICMKLERHSPYPPDDGRPTLFRLDPDNHPDRGTHLYVGSSKRKTPYTITATGKRIPHSPSEFALGHLLPPAGHPARDKQWIAEGWAWAALGGPEPDWLDQPALAQIQLTRYADITRLSNARNDGPRPYDTLIVAQADHIYGRTPDGELPRPVTTNRPDLDPEQADWWNFTTGQQLPPARIPTAELGERALTSSRPLYLRTFRSILSAHIRAPERKSLGPNGRPCTSRTQGLLQPAPTTATTTVPIGRETNYSEETGLLRDPTYTTYPDLRSDASRQNVLAILQARSRQPGGHAELVAQLGLSDSGVRRYLRSGRARAETLQRAHAVALELARSQIQRRDPKMAAPTDLRSLLHLEAAQVTRSPSRCAGCGSELHGRQRRWCATCRSNGSRRRRSATN
jgi:hypothetical protein